MNLTTLKSTVASILNRDDLSSLIETFINGALRAVEQEYNFQYMRTVATSQSADASGYLTKPSRYKATDFLFAYVEGNQYGPLVKHELEYLLSVYDDTDTDYPKAFANYDSTYMLVRPNPLSGTTFTWAYYAYSAELSTTVTTNWVTETAPEVLIYGACLQAAPALIEDERIPVWEKLFKDFFNRIVIADNKEKNSGLQYVKPLTVV